MMRPRHHQFLLVGEGNFSFSAGLCATRGCEIHIVATCYESKEAVSRQALAKSNLQYLRDRGAEVHFGVDCTKLKDHFLPAERRFEHIYFNFPHCGRKAGVKRNRDLLVGFFCSCASILAEKGEVHVALCKGQGGTPADQPTREWHNSWQVVAMASTAGFILREVHPFITRDAHGYKCTGYRSQDKSFCVEGALNHIFTKSLDFQHLGPMISQTELGGDLVSFLVPDIFLDKINRRFLDVNSEHPVRTINEKLIEELSRSLPVQKANSDLSLVFQDGPGSLFTPNTCWMVPVAEENTDWESSKIAKNIEPLAVPSGFLSLDSTGQSQDWISGEKDWVLNKYYLRPSVLYSLHTLLHRTEFHPGTFLALSGLAFRKCKISTHDLPVSHETALGCVVKKGSEDLCLQLLTENITAILSALLRPSGFRLDCTTDEPETQPPHTFLSTEPQSQKLRYFITVTLDTSGAEPKKLWVGTARIAPWRSVSIDQELVYASLNLDLLAMQTCGIFDWRILWTSDECFSAQFAGGLLGPFKSFSLYPPSYVHDVSFWVPKAERFDEVQLHTVARCVSGETVVSLQLRDSFLHPNTGQKSLCYRVTYQSCDKALTQQQAAAMQVKLRDEIQRSLGVTLR